MVRTVLLVSCILASGCGGVMTSVSASTDAGTDGTSANPGDAGASGDAAPFIDAGPFTCSDCLSTNVKWAPTGGLVATVSSSRLNACRQYSHDQGPSNAPGTPGSNSLFCSTDIGKCNDAPIGVLDIERALAHPDVTAALAGSTTLYGSDPRGCDGSVLDLAVDKKTIEIGGDCANANSCGAPSSPCVPVPPGVSALAELLRKLDEQELAKDPCHTVFHP
jgi:hypothetical protein